MTNAEKFIADGGWFRDLRLITDQKHGMYQIIKDNDMNGIDIVYFADKSSDQDWTEDFVEDFLEWLDEDTDND